MDMQYKEKFVTPEQAAKAVQSGDWVDYGFGGGFPELMDRALAARKDELKDVKVRGGLVIRPRIEVVECDPEQIPAQRPHPPEYDSGTVPEESAGSWE